MVSPMVLARRVLGRRGVFFLRSVVSSVFYFTGFYEYADSTGRKDGVSVLMCTYNEEDWVEPALLSVKDLADELVVVDSSNDRTPDIVKHVAEEHGLNLKLARAPPGDILAARLHSLKLSSYKWLLVHDGDVIMTRDGVKVIRSVIESLNPRMQYLVYWKYLLLCGDLEHVCGENPYHVEHWLFTYSSRLTYKYLDYGAGSYMETLIAPINLYKPVYIDRILGVHLTGVRSPEKHALKHIRLKHRRRLLEYLRTGLSDEEAVARIAREIYGTEDLRELGMRLIESMVRELPRYNPSVHGLLPEIVVEHFKKMRQV